MHSCCTAGNNGNWMRRLRQLEAAGVSIREMLLGHLLMGVRNRNPGWLGGVQVSRGNP
jgi:hypothetical protein